MAMATIDFQKVKDEIQQQKDSAGDRQEASEHAMAKSFARRFADELKYCHSSAAWFVWDGTRWGKDRKRLAFSYARDIGEEHGFLGKASECAGVERFAQSDQTLAVTYEVWDMDPFLLGTPGGTVDLRSGELRPADHGDMITKQTSVAPAKSSCPLWLKFLDEATNGDAELMRFLQQWFGYSLTGSVKEHALLFVYGPGGNGKSVFLNVMASVMGDYAKTAPMTTFQASKLDQHSTDIAMLAGARSVTASETEEGRAWAEAKIKTMTGGDPISARFMHRDNFTYQPQFKLLVVGNLKPQIRNVDDAMRRRFNIVPFEHKPPEPDKDLEAKLAAEFPAILQWAIEGCLDWQKNGLIRPEIVRAATDEYFDDQDTIRQWLDTCCNLEPAASCKTSELYGSYRSFVDARGLRPMTETGFGNALNKHGFSNKKTDGTRLKIGGARAWRGLAIKLVCEDEDEPDSRAHTPAHAHEQNPKNPPNAPNPPGRRRSMKDLLHH